MPRPARLPEECWPPIQSGSERALSFMAKLGIQGMVGGGSAEGGAMHSVVLKLQESHSKIGKDIELGERLCVGFHFLIGKDKSDGINRTRKYYDENMNMFAELRLVNVLSEEQMEIMRDPARPPGANLSKVEDAVANGGFLTAGANEIIDHLKALEKRYPGLTCISVSLSVGVPAAEALENLGRFAKEVMPAFKNSPMKVEAAD